MKTDRVIALSIVGLCFLSAISGVFLSSKKIDNGETDKIRIDSTEDLFSFDSVKIGGSKPDIAVIDISGPIMYGASGGFSSSNTNANEIVPALEQAEKDGVKGVLLRLNSPGGTASASHAIYEKLMKMRKSGIKVVSVMQDVAASGAYYIASSSDQIYSGPSTLTGSIGVIMQIPNYSELSNKIGFKTTTIKSGKFKDIGNAARSMTEDENKLLQALIDDTYNEFVKAVSAGRKMPINTVKALSDGRIYTGNQAFKNKLVDKLGSENDAVQSLKKLMGYDKKAKLKNYTKNSWEKFFNDLNTKSPLKGTFLESPEFSTQFNKIPLMLYK
jgi:protease-4